MRLLRQLTIAAALWCSACSGPSTEAPQVTEDGTPAVSHYTGDELPRGVVPDDGVVELPIPQQGADTGQDGIIYAAVLGGYYLMRVQLPEGRFNYQYNLEDDTWSEDDNIHRQCGSTITQAFLLRATGREDFRLSTRHALDYLFSRVEAQEDGSLELSGMGATALLTIATSIYNLHSGDDEYVDELELLGQNLLQYLDLETGEFLKTDSIFLAPGQLLMALEHLHAATGDDKYLDALERAAQWTVANPDAHGWGSYFGLWANEPLTYLYALRPDPAYAEGVFASADPIVAVQHVPGESKEKSWEGGYAQSAETERPNWATCLQLEAVIDAYRMALLAGDEERQATYAQSAQWAAGYLMRLQFRAGETDDHADPGLLLGAVPFSFGSKYVRVDVTHHVVNTLVKTAEYLDLEDFPGARAPDEVSP